MKPFNKFKTFFKVAVYWGVLIGSGFAVAQEEPSIKEAYEYLTGPSSTYPNSFTDKDLEAIGVFRKHAVEAKALIVAKFLSGEQKQPGVNKFLMIFSPEQKHEIVREILSHYPLGTLETPFTGYLAYFGDAEDMQRLKAIFGRHPEAEETQMIATLMAQSGNTHAHAALFAWKEQVPGRWQESPDVQKLYKGKTFSSPPPQQAIAQTSPIFPIIQTDPPRSGDDSPTVGAAARGDRGGDFNSWLWWGLSVVAALLGVTFFWFRRR